tara:strand:- start:7467 stop:8357 length:891 start_codon:yes stop_codon:yes gene_type:complete
MKTYIKKIISKNNFLFFLLLYFKEKNNLKYNDYNFNIIKCYKWLNLYNNKHILLLSYQASGSHFFTNIINFYFNKKLFKNNFFSFDKDHYYQSRKFKYEMKATPKIHHFHLYDKTIANHYKMLFFHGVPNDLPYFRKKLKFNKKIFIIRDPLSNFYSFYLKNKMNKDLLNFVMDNAINSYINFYNSYNEYILYDKKSHLVFSDDLIENKNEKIKSVLEFLNNKEVVQMEILNEAFEFFDFKNEVKRNNYEFPNFYKGLGDYSSKFTDIEKSIIFETLKKKMNNNIFNFLEKKFKFS